MTVSIRSRHVPFISTSALPMNRSTHFIAYLALVVCATAQRWPIAAVAKNVPRMNAEVKAAIVFRWDRRNLPCVSKYSTRDSHWIMSTLLGRAK